ncbi:IQ domain-containing protein M [Erethizon dorsatum]
MCYAVAEQVKLGKIMTDIESVSKQMEKEKQQHAGKSRMLESFYDLPRHFIVPLPPVTSATGLQKEPGPRSAADPFTFLGFSFSIYNPQGKNETRFKERDRRMKGILNKTEKWGSKVKRIRPHIDIFQVFQEGNKFIITKKVLQMITIMQAHIRGWLERRRLQRITAKASYHGPDLKAVTDMYRRLIHRVKYRLGLWRTRQIINLAELEEWMDRKKFYETMFAKREDWRGLERSELLKYFNDCGHFPTQKQIDNYWDMTYRERQKYHEVIKKSQAIEMIFTLYPPRGAHVVINTPIKSTWLRPIINGEEGYKYIGKTERSTTCSPYSSVLGVEEHEGARGSGMVPFISECWFFCEPVCTGYSTNRHDQQGRDGHQAVAAALSTLCHRFATQR